MSKVTVYKVPQYMRVNSNRHNYMGSWSVIMYVAQFGK